LQSGGASGTEGRGTGIASTAASSAPGESGTTGAGQGKSGKAEGLLGVASLLPGVSVDNPDFQFTYYIVIIQNKIASNWNPPFAGGKTDRGPKTLVHFRILRNGQVRDVRVESSSGASLLDQSAVRAISMSNPLPPLPQRFSDDSLGVHFSFELEGGRG
jgi:TonB family protein